MSDSSDFGEFDLDSSDIDQLLGTVEEQKRQRSSNDLIKTTQTKQSGSVADGAEKVTSKNPNKAKKTSNQRTPRSSTSNRGLGSSNRPSKPAIPERPSSSHSSVPSSEQSIRSSPSQPKQATLSSSDGFLSLGGPSSSPPSISQYPAPVLPILQVQPLHHELVQENLSTYIYPTNFPVRDYQFNIVRNALFSNVLCALPTGLGKTFIASVVMLNWYRWTSTAKIIFMAPTKPLVSQQIEACLGITGIPRHDTSILMGSKMPPSSRAVEWREKRVFFATPQTVQIDLAKGYLDPKSIVCLVIDEAHRATGNYSYSQVVRFIQRFSSVNNMRILALTATPSATVEGVQEIISQLAIAKAEIRTEESLDTRQYLQKKEIVRVHSQMSEEQNDILQDLYKAMDDVLINELRPTGTYYVSDASQVTQFGSVKAMQKIMGSPSARAKSPVLFKAIAILKLLSQLGFAIQLIKFQGIRPFYDYIVRFKSEILNGGKKPKYASALFSHPSFISCLGTCKTLIYSPDGIPNQTFLGHPKMSQLLTIMGDFFGEQQSDDSKAIIFSAYRDSAQEIVRVLKSHCPKVKPHMFIGQAGSAKSKKSGPEAGSNAVSGMSQKEQQRVVSLFKSGEINTLIATSIGEEGLDIGEVDLIICYDASASPIRVLQRMGRTGRKRKGRIMMLLTEQEDKKLDKSFDNYGYIQRQISQEEKFQYYPAYRILPDNVQPICEKKILEIPEENKEVLQADDIIESVQNAQKKPVKSKGSKGKMTNLKRKSTADAAGTKPIKRFFMPDNVERDFVQASSLTDVYKKSSEIPPGKPEEPYSVKESGFLTSEQQLDLERDYWSDQINGSTRDILIREYTPDFSRDMEERRNPIVGNSTATSLYTKSIKHMGNWTAKELQSKFLDSKDIHRDHNSDIDHSSDLNNQPSSSIKSGVEGSGLSSDPVDLTSDISSDGDPFDQEESEDISGQDNFIDPSSLISSEKSDLGTQPSALAKVDWEGLL